MIDIASLAPKVIEESPKKKSKTGSEKSLTASPISGPDMKEKLGNKLIEIVNEKQKEMEKERIESEKERSKSSKERKRLKFIEEEEKRMESRGVESELNNILR